MCSRSTGWTFQVVIPASEMAAGVRRTVSGRASCVALGASGAGFAASRSRSSGAGGLPHAAPAATGRQEESVRVRTLFAVIVLSPGVEVGPGEPLHVGDREGLGQARLEALPLRLAEGALRVEEVEERRLALLVEEPRELQAARGLGQDLALEEGGLVRRDDEVREARLQLREDVDPLSRAAAAATPSLGLGARDLAAVGVPERQLDPDGEAVRLLVDLALAEDADVQVGDARAASDGGERLSPRRLRPRRAQPRVRLGEARGERRGVERRQRRVGRSASGRAAGAAARPRARAGSTSATRASRAAGGELALLPQPLDRRP